MAPATPNVVRPEGPVENWSVDGVVQWLNSLSMQKYAGNVFFLAGLGSHGASLLNVCFSFVSAADFRRQVVDGHSLLQLSRQQLRVLVSNSRDRSKVSKAIALLKQNTRWSDNISNSSGSPTMLRINRGSRVFHFPESSAPSVTTV